MIHAAALFGCKRNQIFFALSLSACIFWIVFECVSRNKKNVNETVNVCMCVSKSINFRLETNEIYINSCDVHDFLFWSVTIPYGVYVCVCASFISHSLFLTLSLFLSRPLTLISLYFNQHYLLAELNSSIRNENVWIFRGFFFVAFHSGSATCFKYMYILRFQIRFPRELRTPSSVTVNGKLKTNTRWLLDILLNFKLLPNKKNKDQLGLLLCFGTPKCVFNTRLRFNVQVCSC